MVSHLPLYLMVWYLLIRRPLSSSLLPIVSHLSSMTLIRSPQCTMLHMVWIIMVLLTISQ